MSMMSKLVLKELSERNTRFANRNTLIDKRRQQEAEDHKYIRRMTYLTDVVFLALIACFVAAHWPGPCDGYRYDYETCGPR
jgi:hypothetical protein